MTRSQQLFEKAQQFIPGGVNSPVRAFRGVGGEPLFIKGGEGPYLIDEDDQPYIDYVGSWGPMILGHAHPAVIKAVQETSARGLGFGTPTALEVAMAEKLHQLMPSLDMLRMVNSGTEATMSAIRLARAFTGRDKVLKFEGCYHGHVDSLLVKAGSGALTHGEPSSPGVPKALAELTLTATYNDLASVEEAFKQAGGEVACVIVEPVAGNMNCVPPVEGFLDGLRRLCDEHGAVLIFDEVMTGFRVALGGAQQFYGVTPDLTALGKIIGGGMPVGAFGGRRDIMEMISPLGPVYQAGTLSGNPVAMAAGLATLNELTRPGFYEQLTKKTQRLVENITDHAKVTGIPLTANTAGGMFGLFFSDAQPVTSYQQVISSDTEMFKNFFHGMLKEGIYLAPSPFEAGFVSAAHSDEEIDRTIKAAAKVLSSLS